MCELVFNVYFMFKFNASFVNAVCISIIYSPQIARRFICDYCFKIIYGYNDGYNDNPQPREAACLVSSSCNCHVTQARAAENLPLCRHNRLPIEISGH